MLFLLFGSSCAGKTTALQELRARTLPRLAVHDHDELGVPAAPDTAWRQRTTEDWLRRVLGYQARGVPWSWRDRRRSRSSSRSRRRSAIRRCCGLRRRCDDATRVDRLRRAAAAEPPSRTAYSVVDYLAWAELMRRHVRDPRYGLHVVRENGWVEMRWERVAGLTVADPRWRVDAVDTTAAAPAQVADALATWIERERANGRVT